MLLIATFFIMTVIRPIDTANTVLQWLGISFVFGASLLIPWIYSLFVNPSTGAKSKNVEQDVAIVSGERKKVSDTNGT